VNFARQRRADARLDLTPLIDIIFQLVLFFMVSTTFVSSAGIDVQLPESNADLILRESRDVNVWVTEDGAVLLDDEPVDFDSLSDEFERRFALEPDVTVIIKADQNVGHGRVVQVMDLARQKGLTNLAIATERLGSDGDSGSEQ
jgi:biopolymer transport protein ExbD